MPKLGELHSKTSPVTVAVRVASKRTSKFGDAQKDLTRFALQDATAEVEAVSFEDTDAVAQVIVGQSYQLGPLVVGERNGCIQLKFTKWTAVEPLADAVVPHNPGLDPFFKGTVGDRVSVAGVVVDCDIDVSDTQSGRRKRRMVLANENGEKVRVISFNDASQQYIKCGEYVHIHGGKRSDDDTLLNFEPPSTCDREMGGDTFAAMYKNMFTHLIADLARMSPNTRVDVKGVVVAVEDAEVMHTGKSRQNIVLVDESQHRVDVSIYVSPDHYAPTLHERVGFVDASIRHTDDGRIRLHVFGGVHPALPHPALERWWASAERPPIGDGPDENYPGVAPAAALGSLGL